MTKGFQVTYEIVTPESAEDGEAAEHGFVLEDVSLGEALSVLSGSSMTPSSYPFDPADQHVWYNEIEPSDLNWVTGATETRSLHLPRHLTTSTRRRIARLLGAAR